MNVPLRRHDIASHRVIALHCSAGAPRQWRALGEALGPLFDVMAPGLVGSSAELAWPGARAFAFADEVQPILDLVDEAGGPVHLVGHSYGGAVALGVALARPAQVASLSLYEPLPMQLLKEMGEEGRAAALELRNVSRRVQERFVAGAHVESARAFIEYWGGRDAWNALSPGAASAAIAYLPKLLLEFRAAFGAGAPLSAYRSIAAPALVLAGARTTKPAALLARRIAGALRAQADTLDSAGHMGPVTHGRAVAEIFSAHIRAHAGAFGRTDALAACA